MPGGHMGGVVQQGGTVRRPAGPWTPAVQGLMAALRSRGLEFVPAPMGVDDRGREVIEFVEGAVGMYPMPAWVWSDELLVDVARALRALHDTSEALGLPASRWRRHPIDPPEVICHGDVAPYNTVCRGGRFVAFIDWDFAVPAPRGWDLGYAAYRWITLTNEGHPDGYTGTRADKERRLQLFCAEYGNVDPDDVLGWAVRRLEDLVTYSKERAAAGDPAFQRTIELGHVALYERDAAWLRETYTP